MRMRSFATFVESTELLARTLKDCPVVIDAHAFFFKLYESTKNNFMFGCECENYASYLITYLSMFKRANVKCYFLYKGGNKDRNSFKTNYHHKDFVLGEFVPPMFAKDVSKDVLDDMGLDYTVCEFDSKRECMALALELNCPIVSDNIEYCFSGIDYIHFKTLVFNEDTGGIDCRVFKLRNFLSTYNLREEVLSVLIILTDLGIFPNGYFDNFMRSQQITTHFFNRYSGLLKWLSNKKSRTQALKIILEFVNPEESEKILEEERKARTFIRPRVNPGLPTMSLTKHYSLQIKEKDATWFQKGIIDKYIPMQYANLYHHGVVIGSWPMQDPDQDDAVLLSMDIIKYAYNLMTNYRHDEIKLITREAGETPISLQGSVSKPNYDAEDSVLDNGLREIKDLRLFKHFLDEALPGFYARSLDMSPDDVQLLMIAMCYFSIKKTDDNETKNVAYSVLLSYVALTLLKKDDGNVDLGDQKLATNYSGVNERDIEQAAKKLEKYFTVDDAKSIFNVKLNHVLLEFQYCLQQINLLNQICAKPYKNTIYSKTYNGTFVYKILQTIVEEYDGNGLSFIEQELSQTGTVLDFFYKLVKVYHKMLKYLNYVRKGR